MKFYKQFRRFIKNKKGQIGPMSLEDIPSLTIMLIITMIFIVLIFKVVGGYLETNQAVDMQTSAVQLSNVLKSKSELVYGGQSGVLDESKFDSFDLDKYKLEEYECSIEVKDLRDDGKKLMSDSTSTPPEDKNVISSTTPVAIHKKDEEVHEGLLNVFMWRK